jgi:hypothetical protein
MSEYILEDGRKAERKENSLDSLTKVTEVYVEPKTHKKLAQRITERLCVCERQIETIDEDTGEVVERVVENLCGSPEVKSVSAPSGKSAVQMAVESKMNSNLMKSKVVFGAILLAQVAALMYVIFFM